MKKALKNNLSCFVSAFLAGTFFLFACYHFKVFPFGNEYSIFKIDLVHQYAPMLNQLYDLIKSGKSLTYSWNSGLGYSFIGNYFTYIASPFNLIVLLFNRENIPNAVSIIIMLKTMLTAGSFSYYLKKAFKAKDALNVGFSLLYAFSGWYIAYYWNIMWLDVLFCLPLAVVGLQKIFNGKKPCLYILTLSYALFTSYYTAYMLCLFLCVYFIYYYISNNSIKKDFSDGFFKSELWKSGWLFAASSIAAAFIMAVVLVPMFFILTKSSAVTDSFENGIELFFGPLSFWTQHFSGVMSVLQISEKYDAPNVWCGMLAVILLPVWFLSKKVSVKERLCDLFLLLFMALSLGINILCFVWCGFHFPNGFGDRISFLYIFVVLTITFKAIQKSGEYKPFAVGISGLTTIAFIIFMYAIPDVKVEKFTLIISIGFTLVWVAFYYISRIKKTDKSLLKVVVLFFICAELVFSQLENLDFNYFRDDYDGGSKQIGSTVEMIRDNDNEMFFRIETSTPRAYILPMIVGYEGISDFSSVTDYEVALNQCTLGMGGNKENYFTYSLQTPVYDSSFALKYLISDNEELKNSPYYNYCFENNGFSVYENKYYLPIGYCVKETTSFFHTQKNENPFFAQSDMFGKMSASEELFNYCEPESVISENLTLIIEREDETSHTKCYSAKLLDETQAGFVSFNFVLPDDGEYYLICDYRSCDDGAKIDISGESINLKSGISNMVYESNGIKPVGKRTKGNAVTIKVPVTERRQGEPISVYLASFNKDKFIEGYNKLSQHTLNLTEFENTHFKGTVTADEDCLLFTSIPYDKGWHIKLDGNAVDENDIVAIDDAYISVPLTKGDHTVEFDYFPQGLKAGAIISVTTVCGLIAYLIIKKKRK